MDTKVLCARRKWHSSSTKCSLFQQGNMQDPITLLTANCHLVALQLRQEAQWSECLSGVSVR